MRIVYVLRHMWHRIVTVTEPYKSEKFRMQANFEQALRQRDD